MTFRNASCEIPDELVFRHEAGGVVFFCGAGMSYDAGIPVFSGLFEKTREYLGVELDQKEQDVVNAGQFDQAFQILERHLDERYEVRRIAAKYLDPSTGRIPQYGLSKHKAILQLSKTRDRGHVHLVTTNYDQLFDRAGRVLGWKRLREFAAPLLPIPKAYDWDGVVYLHGKLNAKKPDRENLDNLILTSGDFGVAYLSERWASRFVSELFKKFTVCFVGYGVNDVILRYMMDAIASEEMRGEAHRPVYAFDGCLEGGEAAARAEWAAKGIDLIAYRKNKVVRNGRTFEDHSELRKVLDQWAKAYTEDISGKARIVCDEMSHEPDSVSNEGQNAIRRVAWALSDQTGVPAKRLSELATLPSIRWLDELEKVRLKPEWLRAFGVPVAAGTEYDRPFSIFSHPPTLANAPHIGLVPTSDLGNLDTPQNHLLSWLIRYLPDVRLFNWFVQHVGVPSVAVCGRILNALPEHCRDQRLSDSWRAYLHGIITSYDAASRQYALYGWLNAYKALGGVVTPALAMQFRSYIQPRLNFVSVYGKNWDEADAYRPEVLLAVQGMTTVLEQDPENLRKAIVPFVRDLVVALEHICELREGIDGSDDLSYFSLPTIEKSDHEHVHDDWSADAVLLREAWLGWLKDEKDLAVAEARRWAKSKYSLFWRFYLFAATECIDVTVADVVSFLTSKGSLLDNAILHHEVVRFIDGRGVEFKPDEVHQLESIILPRQGQDEPIYVRYTRTMFLDHLDDAGCELSGPAHKFLEEARRDSSVWKRRNRKFDGLKFYVCDEGEDYPSEELSADVLPSSEIPKDDVEAVIWLKSYGRLDVALPPSKDPWQKLCLSDPARAVDLLLRLGAGSDKWVDSPWTVALDSWRESKVAALAWAAIGVRWQKIPQGFIARHFTRFAWWLQNASKEDGEDGELVIFCDEIMSRVAGTPIKDGICSIDAEMPYRCLAEAILRRWYGTHPKRGMMIQEPFRGLFSAISAGETYAYRCARNELLEHITDFFIVDSEWTRQSLVPLLNWDTDAKVAIMAWEHAVVMPRYDSQFMKLVKTEFLHVTAHYNGLGSVAQEWYCTVIAHMAMSRCEGFSAKDFSEVIRGLPQQGRDLIGNRVFRRMDATTNGDLLWAKELEYFISTVWPRGPEYMKGEPPRHFMCAITNLDRSFQSAVDALLPRIINDVPLDLCFMRRLWDGLQGGESLCSRYPYAAIRFLAKCSFEFGMASYGEKCLEQIRTADTDAKISRSPEFKTLVRKVECAKARY